MTEEEVEVVARELAKAGGIAWYPGRTTGPLLRLVSERYRNRARTAISALERLRAGQENGEAPQDPAPVPQSDETSASHGSDDLTVGAIVVYRPPGDQRAVPCKIEKLENGRAYLVPCPKPDYGWVSLDDLSPQTAEGPRED